MRCYKEALCRCVLKCLVNVLLVEYIQFAMFWNVGYIIRRTGEVSSQFTMSLEMFEGVAVQVDAYLQIYSFFTNNEYSCYLVICFSSYILVLKNQQFHVKMTMWLDKMYEKAVFKRF